MGIGLLALALTLAVGLSRLVLDAHWPLDVVAGFALGAAGAAVAAWWDTSHPPQRPAKPPRSRVVPRLEGQLRRYREPRVSTRALARLQRAGGNSASLRARGHPKLPACPFRVTSAETFTTLRSSPATCPPGLQAKVTSNGAPLIVPKSR